MRLPVVWTLRALSDLEAIGDYISRDSASAAERWVAMLTKTAEGSGTAPWAGRRVPELSRDDVHEFLLRSYRIVYRVNLDRVEILTVFEGHRLFPAGVESPSDDTGEE